MTFDKPMIFEDGETEADLNSDELFLLEVKKKIKENEKNIKIISK